MQSCSLFLHFNRRIAASDSEGYRMDDAYKVMTSLFRVLREEARCESVDRCTQQRRKTKMMMPQDKCEVDYNDKEP